MPDVVLLDIGLPDMTGWKLLEHIRERHAATGMPKVIVITAFCKTTHSLHLVGYNKPRINTKVIALLGRVHLHSRTDLRFRLITRVSQYRHVDKFYPFHVKP